jgi:hypothetical protein
VATGLSRGTGSGATEPTAPGLPESPDPTQAIKGWTAGRVATLVAGSVLILISLILLCGAGALAWADHEQQGGYLTTGAATYSTGGYALASNPVELRGGWGWLGRFAGDVRIQVTAVSPAQPVFVAIGPAADVSRYLAGVSYTTVTAVGDHDVTQHPGRAVPAPPANAVDWVAQAAGTGTQTLRWTVQSGDWMVVVMNPHGSPGMTVRADVGVTSPVLPSLAVGLLAAGLTAGLLAGVLIVIPIRMASGS